MHDMASVGIGWVNTLNAPPGTTGQIPQTLVTAQGAFGDALRAMLMPVTSAASAGAATLQCGDGDGAAVEIDLGSATAFNAVMSREDLSGGQKITSYAVDTQAAGASTWVTLPTCVQGTSCDPSAGPPPHPLPPLAHGTCGKQLDKINLVFDAPPSTHVAAKTDDAAACHDICAKDDKCNFWTWHDETTGSVAKSCYVRYDSTYDYHPQDGHFSGVCNHTLPATGATLGGVHGLSVGARMIDLLPETTARKVRFRCTGSMAADDSAALRSFSVHRATPPKASEVVVEA